MARDEQISPRAAIRSWLQDTATGPGFARHAEKAKQPDPRNARRRSQRLIAGDPKRSRSPQASSHPQRDGSKLDDGLERKAELPRISSMTTHQIIGSEGPNLAERLGLHAPFRRFKDHTGGDELGDSQSLHRIQKRRHRQSSADSYLELANTEGSTKHDCDVVRTKEVIENEKKSQKHADVSAKLPSEPSTESVTKVPCPERRTKAYERKRRHKTRVDHYDLKEDGGTRRKRTSAEKNGSERKRKPRKRKEKSGAALLHDFTAQNVSQDRLTVSCFSGTI